MNTADVRRATMAPLVGVYRRTPERSVIDADLDRWAVCREVSASSRPELLALLLTNFPEFRTLFYYRLDSLGMRSATMMARRLWRPMTLLDIGCDDIGPGLVISHGHGTILTARRIGRDCWVHHQVTVGSDYRGDLPTIGDGVFIGVGAKILGGGTVGDGVRIGANAVVVHDLPPGATAVGVPARVVHRGHDG